MTPISKFESLYEEEYDAVFAFCARRVGPVDAADVVADVFAVVWRRIDDLPPGNERAWLFGVARNTVSNRWRSGTRKARLIERLRGTRVASVVGPDVEVLRTEEAARVLDALHTLKASDQEILVLSAWDELPSAEIAHILGISVAAVDQRVHRAKQRLGRALAAAESLMETEGDGLVPGGGEA